MKKLFGVLLVLVTLLSLVAVCAAEDYHIGIVTGSVSQSEDSRRGAEAFEAKYGKDIVKLAVYPDNFSEELETYIQTIVGMADDPLMKAIVVNAAMGGTTEAFRQIREIRPDILLISGEAAEDLPIAAPAADLICNNDFLSRGYLIIRSAHELGCDTFVHITFPRHLGTEGTSRELAIMKAAAEEFGMKFGNETGPDPLSDVGVSGSQAYILEKAPEWIEKYGPNTAFFCTSDAHTEPLIKQILEYGGYFIEADQPSPLMGYPGALGLDFSDAGGDFEKITKTVEDELVKRGGAGRFGTWVYSNSYTITAGLAQHAMNVIEGKSELLDIDDISAAYATFCPGADWNGSNYVVTDTGVKLDNVYLLYQDTYMMGDPGFYMHATDVEVPEKYYYIAR